MHFLSIHPPFNFPTSPTWGRCPQGVGFLPNGGLCPNVRKAFLTRLRVNFAQDIIQVCHKYVCPVNSSLHGSILPSQKRTQIFIHFLQISAKRSRSPTNITAKERAKRLRPKNAVDLKKAVATITKKYIHQYKNPLKSCTDRVTACFSCTRC